MTEPASTAVSGALRGQTPLDTAGAPPKTQANQEHPLERLKAADQAGKAAVPTSQPTTGATTNIPEDLWLERSRVAPGLYKPVPEVVVFEWRSLSRPFKKRNRQFFVTVTVIALLVSLILFFSGQLLPIAVVISVLFLLYVLQVVPPQEINHQVTTFGIKLEDNLYYWQEMGRFWFDKKYGQLLLNIETLRFPGRITLVLSKDQREPLKEILSEVLLEQKPELTAFEKISQWFQEKIPLE
ncbi:MAG TPA: hypothetical protein VGA89_03695 [Patescibacteria group bacterium]|jgi:hypothetical protein